MPRPDRLCRFPRRGQCAMSRSITDRSAYNLGLHSRRSHALSSARTRVAPGQARARSIRVSRPPCNSASIAPSKARCRNACMPDSESGRHFCDTSLARMVGTVLWLGHLEACPMRAPSSTAWPTKCLISQEEMWGSLRIRTICSSVNFDFFMQSSLEWNSTFKWIELTRTLHWYYCRCSRRSACWALQPSASHESVVHTVTDRSSDPSLPGKIEHAVPHRNGLLAMSDDDPGDLQIHNCVVDNFFVLAIQMAGRFIEHEDLRLRV